jgi:hypothetical protein
LERGRGIIESGELKVEKQGGKQKGRKAEKQKAES